ncbi:tetratricopeptide repeat protein 38-like [Branchiostoma floridae x Branchiostoma japonicum]
MYDAVVTQYIGWYDDDSVGGLKGAMEKMNQEDPDFVMGKVVSSWFQLGRKSIRRDENLRKYVEDLVRSGQGDNCTYREKQHVEAIRLLAERDTPGACNVWENILVEHPTDILALKLAHMSYCNLGYFVQLRDSAARVLPAWKPSMPLYG